jgi:galactose mutarotase-like enzyme
MAEIIVEARQTNPLITLRSSVLAVAVTPGKGGDIVSIRHLPTGREVLWQTPWGGRPGGYTLPESDAGEAWLLGYTGGWQLLVPNGGTACVHDGVRQVFHGEAALAPWQWAERDGALDLRLAFFTLPLVMTRRLALDGDLLTIEETLTNDSRLPIELVWGHHPGFGGALLDGPARLTCGARRVVVDDHADERGNALLPGTTSDWPMALDEHGHEIDLRAPLDGRHGMAYLQDFTEGWAGLTRTDGSIGIALSWDAALFPTAWLWQELGGSTTPPWFGRARVVGIEPCTSWPGHGLAAIAASTGTQLRLAPGETRATTLRLHVFTGIGEVAGVREGRAVGME